MHPLIRHVENHVLNVDFLRHGSLQEDETLISPLSNPIFLLLQKEVINIYVP